MPFPYKNINIHYTDTGQGEALVLLHGFLENSSIWQPFVPDFSKNHRVVCIDLLGHGQTGCLGYIHTMDTMAEAVYALLFQLNIKKAVFIGHSMGGYVALALAEQYPKLINGLVLANSTARPDSPERKQNRDHAIRVVKQNPKAFVSMGIANLFAPNNRKAFKKEIEQLKIEALKMHVQGILSALEGMKVRPDRKAVLRNPSFKTLMIMGKKDPVLDYKDQLSEARDNAVEVVEFPDGHMSFIENKSEFSQKIMHFVEKT